MGMFAEKSATDQFGSGLFFLVAGLLITPYLAAGLVWVAEKMNSTLLGSLMEWQVRGFIIGRYFFAVCGAVIAALGAARLAIYMAVRSGLIPAPWGGSA